MGEFAEEVENFGSESRQAVEGQSHGGTTRRIGAARRMGSDLVKNTAGEARRACLLIRAFCLACPLSMPCWPE
jgi:hypothetical protein